MLEPTAGGREANFLTRLGERAPVFTFLSNYPKKNTVARLNICPGCRVFRVSLYKATVWAMNTPTCLQTWFKMATGIQFEVGPLRVSTLSLFCNTINFSSSCPQSLQDVQEALGKMSEATPKAEVAFGPRIGKHQGAPNSQTTLSDLLKKKGKSKDLHADMITCHNSGPAFDWIFCNTGKTTRRSLWQLLFAWKAVCQHSK